MGMFEQTGEFRPDSLIAGNKFPVLTDGIGLKAGQGVLKRGSLIVKGDDKAGYIAGFTATPTSGEDENASASEKILKVKGILTDDFDTGTDVSANNIPATVYLTGEFNRESVIVAGEDATIEIYEDVMKNAGIYLRAVQGYE